VKFSCLVGVSVRMKFIKLYIVVNQNNKIMKWSTLSFLLIAATIALLFAAGCAGFGNDNSIRPPWGPANKTPTPVVSAAPTSPSVTVATPFPTPVSTSGGLPNPTFRNPPASVTQVAAFTKILETTYYFDYNNTVFYYELTTPPMIIDYTVIPEMITEEKVITSQYGAKETKTVTVTRPSEYSWFEITVRNKDNGEQILFQGFGKNYNNWVPEQQLTLRNPGTYQFEMKGGHNVRLAVTMKVAA